ncbi:MAG: hypothetical protein JAY85_00025 [Candidatus Thiodiazotropha weberae]|uniref:Asl1-like glycosyl hydrolase catalytic domain-containing protein n=1 Tax=Candidatus Thiodiazotropha endoloripes TaxID=1818881 RepID=A0A1E2UR53_9GAMM|nr:hypothetical protein [Candidatus Thiodiazotropha endoloripes]MCG7896823.1 hypothetical protein [Candidatus Thiodiazotropha weberae]MCG7903389.1 hypothetical protein [Candidatus Thiodiazotropha weberae]ODB86099.1 hypothetical protein A3195_10620 [Candidatus Thiodiazotropha endoloripes]ODB97216.1 hypothetical protein A3196_10865 [Candidatus Thiodiazotropha endoloripes]
MIKKVFSLLMLCILSTTTIADITTKDLIIGVGTHFGQSASYYHNFKLWSYSSGITSFRDEIYWSNVEKVKYKFVLSDGAKRTYETIIENKAQLKPLVILNYGNKLYGKGGLPNDIDSIRAFGRYAKWIVNKTKKYTDMYELWNEWNIGMGSEDKYGSEIAYVKLAKHTYAELKNVDTSPKLLVGALAKDNGWSWLESSIKLGLLEVADGLSIHLYNHCNNKKIGSDELVERLDSLSRMLSKYGFEDIPIYITEIGWPMHENNCGVTQKFAATHILRSLLEISLRETIHGVWIYEFMDRPKNKYKDYGFGLLSEEGSEKKSGCIVRNYADIIKKRPVYSNTKNSIKAAIFSSWDSNYIFIWAKQRTESKHNKMFRNKIKSPKITLIKSNKDLANSKLMNLCGIMSGTIEIVSKDKLSVSIDSDYPIIIKVNKNIDTVSII